MYRSKKRKRDLVLLGSQFNAKKYNEESLLNLTMNMIFYNYSTSLNKLNIYDTPQKKPEKSPTHLSAVGQHFAPSLAIVSCNSVVVGNLEPSSEETLQRRRGLFLSGRAVSAQCSL